MSSVTIKKLLWALFLSVAFMSLLLYGVNWGHFSSIAHRVKMNELFIAFGFLLFANIIRSFRFYTLDHVGKRVTPWLVMNKVYNFITATLPGGVGEAATIYLIKRYIMFDILVAFRILLLSRVLDLAGISAILFLVANLLKGGGFNNETIIVLSGVLLTASVLALVPKTEHLILGLMQKLPGRNRIMIKAREKLTELAKVTEVRRNARSSIITLGYSLLFISCVGVSLHFILLSYDVEFTKMQSFYCYTIYSILQLIPIQGIAGIGTQPARWVVALNMAGYKGPETVALSIIIHGTFYVFISIMGVSALLIWLISRRAG